jgi:hypothetical protein
MYVCVIAVKHHTSGNVVFNEPVGATATLGNVKQMMKEKGIIPYACEITLILENGAQLTNNAQKLHELPEAAYVQQSVCLTFTEQV